MSDTIPVDPVLLDAEIEELLEVTPITSERGRLFHLMKALIDMSGGGGGGGAPFLLGTFTTQDATATNDQVAVDGGAALVNMDGQSLRVSWHNANGVNIGEVFDALAQSNQSWRVGLVNDDTGFTQQLVGTITGISVGTGDRGLNTFAFSEGVSSSFTTPGAVFRMFAIPEAGGGSHYPTVWQGTADQTWTLESFDNRPSSVTAGRIAFVGDSSGDLGGITEIILSNTAPDGETYDLLSELVSNASGVRDWGRLIFHGASDGSTGDQYYIYKITNALTGAGGVIFEVEADPDGVSWASNSSTLTGDFEWIYAPQDIANSGQPFTNFGSFIKTFNVIDVSTTTGTVDDGQMRTNAVNAASITSVKFGFATTDYGARAKITTLANGDTIGLVVGATVHYLTVSAVDNTVGGDTLLTIATAFGDTFDITIGETVHLVKVP